MSKISTESATQFVNPVVRLFRRIYYVDPVDSCNPGWYLRSHTGRVFGPFMSERDAKSTFGRLTI